jgi:hypothetical protein
MTDWLNKLKEWPTQQAKQYTFQHFPGSDYEVDPLTVYGSYFRITVSQIFLSDSRKWFRNLYPAAHTHVRIQHADYEPVELTHITHTGENEARGVKLNYPVTGLIPYNGGTLEIDCGLIALQGGDYLQETIGVLGSFSGLISAPIEQAITVAGKIAEGVQNLMVGKNGQIHLNYHQAYTDTPGGNVLRPGHYAAILATKDDLKDKTLSVQNDQLLADGNPFTGYDYLLFRIDSVLGRPDWRLKNIQKNINAAKQAYLRRRDDEGDEYKAAALVAIFDSPDLSEYDRSRVAQAIRDELIAFQQRGHGAVSEDLLGMPLDQIVKTRAMSWDAAAALGKPSLSDLLGN